MRVPVPRTVAELAVLIDHTLLTPEATAQQAQAMANEATALGCASVCISPSRLPLVTDATVCAVVGFPSGAHTPEVKSAEAAYAIVSGAAEIDMVLDLGAVKAGAWTDVEDDVAAVHAATAGRALLKVIIEAAALTDGEVTGACEAAGRAGAAFVKTSTGFHPAGGASEHAVALMRAVVGDELGVKASGGIRTTQAALAMIAAGANRLGCSGTRTVLAGMK